MLYSLSIGVVLFTLFVGWLQFTWLTAFLSTFVIYLVSGGWRFVRLLYLTLPRDLRYIWKAAFAFHQLRRMKHIVPKIFEKTVQKYGDQMAFIFEDKQWTFQEVDSYSNQVANYFQSIGYKKGDVVALFMENRPELVFFWLGLSKIGVISALVNYNLKKEPLSHSISIVNSKGLIYSANCDMTDAVSDIHPSIKGVELFKFGGGLSNGLKDEYIEEKLKDYSEEPPVPDCEIGLEDVLFYIYTSGTTGVPKACIIRHERFLMISVPLNALFQLCSNDILYNVLPMYHTQGGIVGVGSTLLFGQTMVCCRKFSASRFWVDCVKYKATWFIYIGELCRYLLVQPPKETDKAHSVRFLYGNGLRPQIWEKFKERFNIPVIYELYGATEGNVGFLNLDGRPGAVGALPVFLPTRWLPNRLFKMNPESGELLRGPDGFCVPCKRGEIGQMAGQILQDNAKNFRRFDGYHNKEETKKKIAKDVAKKGDQWFLTGDSFYWDELGYLYFRDRLGDTFRWRGENVSTTEIEGMIIKILGLHSVVVYGVEIPGCEGRAGMAAIEDPDDVIDIEFLGRQLSESLPSYARPIFLRITNSVDTTGTFKLQKIRLRKEGFNLSIISDKLFYLDQKNGEYLALTKDIHRKFENGEMRT